MEDNKDIKRKPLIDLVIGLTNIDRELGMILVEKDRLYRKTTKLKKEYNEIIAEIVRRFPPLENDINLQPKKLRKRKGE